MSNPFLYLLLGLIAAWIGSYFFSMVFNRAKILRIAQWLKSSVGLLGNKPVERWLGTDRLDITLTEGRENTREAVFVIGLQSKQLFKAVMSVLQGGRDSLSVLVSLKNSPTVNKEFEIFETRGPLPKSLMLDETIPQWETGDYNRSDAYRIAYRSVAARESANRVLTLLLDEGFQVRRLSVRPTIPHIFLIINFYSMPKVESAALVRVVKNLCDELTESPKPKPPPPPSKPDAPKSIKLHGKSNYRLN